MKDFCCECSNTIDSCTCSTTTIEYCPHHDGEVEIDADNPTKCPECGIEILPCSTCDELKRGCNWDEGFGCWRFPKEKKLSVDKVCIRDVSCQNCNNVLASFVEGNFRYDPNEITSSEDAISADETLITLICQKCSCVCQVIV